MIPWDVPGGIVGCYMRYGSGDRAIKRMGLKKQNTKKMGTEKERQGSRTRSCLCFHFVLPSTHSPTTWQIPRGGLPFEPGTGSLVGKFELNPAVKDY